MSERLKKGRTMNTERSDRIVAGFKERDWEPRRVIVEYEGTVQGTSEEVFPLLCPSREADWIPGWEAELIHTETGFAELGCVFTTDETGPFGPGVWVFVGFEKDRFVELVRFMPNILIQIRVAVEPDHAAGGSGGSTVRWDYALTGLTPEGSAMLPDSEAMQQKLGGACEALDHYLRTGEMIGS
jgi:hypothetical protein